jgi:opacity protein-like surface antigen
MNYKQKFCVTLFSSLVSLPALADLGNPYASGKIGWAWENVSDIKNVSLLTDATPNKTSMDESLLSYGAAVGYRFNSFYVPIRFEADYTYRNNLSYNADPVYVGGTDSFKSTLQSQNILGNVYIDIPVLEMFGFFIGGGGGLAFNRTTNKLYTPATLVDPAAVFESTTDRNGLAWMATAGLSILPAHWLALDLSYRYSGLGSVRWTDLTTELDSYNFNAQEVFLTFRFTLPSRDYPCCKNHMPYKPAVIVEEEPIPVRKPITKAPAYKPKTKGATYEEHPSKGAVYEPEKGAKYDPNRARRVKKNSKTASRY